MTYNPTNWYWIVGSSTTQVWSSARLEYVALTDATYVAWLAAGGAASRIASGDLYGVMAQQVVPALMTAGVSIMSTGTPTLNATYALDPGSQAQITSVSTGIAAGKPLPGGGSTFNWADAGGTPHAFTSANFLNFAAALETFIYNFNTALTTLCAGGTATLPATSITIA